MDGCATALEQWNGLVFAENLLLFQQRNTHQMKCNEPLVHHPGYFFGLARCPLPYGRGSDCCTAFESTAQEQWHPGILALFGE